MAGEFKNITIKFRGDASELSAALARINTDMRGTSRDLNDVNRLMRFKEGAESIDLMGQKVRLTTDRVNEWRERVSTLESAQAELGERTENNADKYDRVTLRLQEARVQMEHYVSEMHDAEQMYDRNATKLGAFGGALREGGGAIKEMGDRMQRVGGTLTRSVTLPLVAMGTASIRAATDIDSALANVRKTVDGTEEDYERLKEAAMQAAEQQPVDAATLLNIEALGAQLSFSLDELDEFARVASGLDVSTNMDWEQAATEMAQFANVMKMSHGDIGRYGSTIVELGNNFATTESDISAMAQRIMGAGAQLDMSVPEVLGLSAALTSMGITAEAGGSAISTVMSNIDKDVATGSENLGKWAEIAGQTPEEFAESWDRDVVGTLGNVLTAMGDLEENGGNLSVLLDDLGIGSIRQTDTLKRLAGNSELYSKAIGMANDAYEENTALSDEVANKNESLASKFQVLANKISNIAAEIGEPLADALLDVADAAEPLLKKVGDVARAFADMEPEQQKSIIKWGLMAAAAGPVLTVMGKLTSGVGGAVMGIGNAAQTLSGFFGQLKRGEGIMSAVTSTFSGAGTAIMGLKVAVGALAIGAVIAGIAAIAKAYQDTIKQQRDFYEALADMGTYIDAGEGHVSDFRDTVGMTSTEADRLTTSTKELTDMLVRHNDAMEGIESGAKTTISQLERYRDVVDELGGKGDLSAEQQAKLQWAIDGLNDSLGTSIELQDVKTGQYEDENGEIQNTIEMLDKLIDKRQEEARTKADQELYDEALKNETQLQDAYADSKKAFEEYHKSRIFYYRQTPKFAHASEEEIADAVRMQDEKYRELEQNYHNAGFAAQAASDEVIRAETRMANNQALINAGVSVSDFSEKLRDAGLSSSDLASVATSDFQWMLSSCGGDINRLIDMIRDYNNTDMNDKNATVDANGNVIDGSAKWHVDDFRNSVDGLFDKTVTVTYRTINETINRAATSLSNLMGGDAKGGVIPHYAGGVIFTGPTIANIGGRTSLVGEQGAEAHVSAGRNNYIVPLTNKQYSQPFIDDVAAGVVQMLGMMGLTGGGGDSYTINGLSYLPGSAVAGHVEAIFREVLLEEG